MLNFVEKKKILCWELRPQFHILETPEFWDWEEKSHIFLYVLVYKTI